MESTSKKFYLRAHCTTIYNSRICMNLFYIKKINHPMYFARMCFLQQQKYYFLVVYLYTAFLWFIKLIVNGWSYQQPTSQKQCEARRKHSNVVKQSWSSRQKTPKGHTKFKNVFYCSITQDRLYHIISYII